MLILHGSPHILGPVVFITATRFSVFLADLRTVVVATTIERQCLRKRSCWTSCQTEPEDSVDPLVLFKLARHSADPNDCVSERNSTKRVYSFAPHRGYMTCPPR